MKDCNYHIHALRPGSNVIKNIINIYRKFVFMTDKLKIQKLNSKKKMSYADIFENIRNQKSIACIDSSVKINECKPCLLKNQVKYDDLYCCSNCFTIFCLECGHMCNTNYAFISVDLDGGSNYCTMCQQNIYHDLIEFHLKYNRFISNAYKKQKTPQMILPRLPWAPNSKTVKCLIKNSQPIDVPDFGLKGIINLGNTCFMSCVLQSLCHTVPLRDYFLSDIHQCTELKMKQCLVCEISVFVQKIVSNDLTPVSPHKILHLLWTLSSNMTGYKQQDAHECFMLMLNSLHRHSESTNGSQFREDKTIVEKLFSGRLQSDVQCTNCKNISTTCDPFWDISLNIGSGNHPKTIENCLQCFTERENLDNFGKIFCDKCNSSQICTKQLSMNALPKILTFHIKRFHSVGGVLNKLSTVITYPPVLSMSPYRSHRIAQSWNAADPDKSTPENYELYGVTMHVGSKTTNGHYICYIKCNENWYRCEDNYITKEHLQSVLNVEAYILYYQRL
ncbi:hypothetical protein A3Q56_04230 [Intoshia linei]|uniref:Ubiquitin carboxyl-terminal hydrolase n=1 Tax=Intoshia linei TaxID=1819745 RepID=A0A177B1E6_9BILA|nr:hypothetical protein A3Q56_04230 [Intoshia linei]